MEDMLQNFDEFKELEILEEFSMFVKEENEYSVDELENLRFE